MAPYLPRPRVRRDAWSDLLAALARSLDRRLDVSLMRGAFETALGRVIPVRGVQLREIGSRWGTRVATAVSESVVLAVPGAHPSSAGRLAVPFDPGCRLGAWAVRVLGMPAHPGARALGAAGGGLVAEGGGWSAASRFAGGLHGHRARAQGPRHRAARRARA